MKTLMKIIFCFVIMLNTYSQGIIIDHGCTDLLQIPQSVIIGVKDSIKWHYCHTSHGAQLLCGMDLIEVENPVYAEDWNNVYPVFLPTTPNTLCIYNGNCGFPIEQTTYYTNPLCTYQTLNSNPSLNVSQFSWCTELDSYSAEQVDQYLLSINSFEQLYPNVTFVYMTGNAQSGGSVGYNRYLRNQQIRNFCIANNKVLFDFEDLDSWYNGEQNTYVYNGVTIPLQHSAYNGQDCGHVNSLGDITKGQAEWWLLSRLTGWNPNGFNHDLWAQQAGMAGQLSMDLNNDGQVNNKDKND